MLTLPNIVRVYVATKPVHMGKSFDGLSALAQTELKKDTTDGSLFVFFNRKANKVKIIYYDRNGYAIWYKRLEAGKFRLPTVNSKSYKLSISDLNLLLEGIDLLSNQRLKAV